MPQHAHSDRSHKYPAPPSLAELGLRETNPSGQRRSGENLTKLKKFRFQLLSDWLIEQYAPCRVADIGGGKGLLAYLLRERGWQATVVDPHEQALPSKYKDLQTDRRVRIDPQERVPRIPQPFTPDLAVHFDLLLGLHAHACNIRIIEAAKQTGCNFVLLPCCVIDEPATPPANRHWLPWLADLARQRGFAVEHFQLNFKGQNIGLYNT
jgi:hypothetical protein